MNPIPISAAAMIAKRYGYDQVVIIARKVDVDDQPGGEHVTTYGRDKANCSVAARMGDFLKYKVMGWTPEQSPTIPANFVLVPEQCTPFQYEAMRVFAEVMLTSVGKLDLNLIYACGVSAFSTEEIMATDVTPAETEKVP